MIERARPARHVGKLVKEEALVPATLHALPDPIRKNNEKVTFPWKLTLLHVPEAKKNHMSITF